MKKTIITLFVLPMLAFAGGDLIPPKDWREPPERIEEPVVYETLRYNYSCATFGRDSNRMIAVTGDLNFEPITRGEFRTWGEAEFEESENNLRYRRNSKGQTRLDHSDDIEGYTRVTPDRVTVDTRLEDPQDLRDVRRGDVRFHRNGRSSPRIHFVYMGEHYSGRCTFVGKNSVSRRYNFMN